MKTGLLVIDVQQSFVHRPYFVNHGLDRFLASQNALIEGARAAGCGRRFECASNQPI
jgi:nicotinamidase-related amidase